jgi:hypothetical protein
MITPMTTGNSGNTPAQRIGHRERDATVERLRVAAGEGQITFEELETRMEAALAARTAEDIVALVADLPMPAGGTSSVLEPAAPAYLAVRHGRVERLGAWRVPEEITLELRHSSCALDLRTPPLPANGVRITVDARHSSIKILVAHSAAVEMDNIARGHSATKDRRARAVSALNGPPIVLTGTLQHSSIRILRPGEGLFGRLSQRRQRRAQLTAVSGHSRALPPAL